MSSSAAPISFRARFILGGVVFLLLLISAGACFDDSEEPAGPEADSQASVQASVQGSLVPVEHRRFPNADEKRAMFAEKHPGFAGIYRLPNRGKLVVQVTEDADAPAVVDAMRQSREYGKLFLRMPGVVIETVQRNFLSLFETKKELDEMIGQNGGTSNSWTDKGRSDRCSRR